MKHNTITLAKFKALSKRLRLSLCETVGVLETLWLFTIHNARSDGDLSRFTNLEISGWMEFEGNENDLVDALVETGWLDRNGDRLVIHDWEDHKPNWLKAARKSPVTKPLTDASLCEPLSGTLSDTLSVPQSARQNAALPTRTKPNQTKPKAQANACLSPDADDREAEFLRLWNETPGVVPARGVSGKRRVHLRSRLRESGWWEHFLEARRKFPLGFTLQPKVTWRPDADWILKPDSVSRILEGKYDQHATHREVTPFDLGLTDDPNATEADL